MANFVVVIDEDRERRTQYLTRVESMIAPVDGLAVARLDHHEAGAVWAAVRSAPINSFKEGDRGALLFGNAKAADSAKSLTASDLARHWDAAATGTREALDGYFAGVTFQRGAALFAGADLLGLHPVYYAATSEVVIVSSTPELIPLHPAFPKRLSLEGLIGVLLTDALVDERTILEGVRRLQPGHALVWRSGVGASETLQYTLPLSNRESTHTFQEHVEQLDAALEHAIRRHAPTDEPHGIMLSGGRDSRMLAGYLEEQGRTARALTMGGPGDFDVTCAAQVSRALGWQHRVVAAESSDAVRTALFHAKWDHLSSGFNSPHLWSMIDPLRQLAPSFTHGYIMGPLAGGEGVATPNLVTPWASFFRQVNARGIESATLKRLLRSQQASDAVDSVVERMRAVYEQWPEQERVWRFQLASTSRHRVGSIPWRLSFGSWPVLPILDRSVMHAVASLPGESLANRHAQDEILRRRFPHLARVPVVVGNVQLEQPLAPSRMHRTGQRFTNVLERLRPRPRKRERGYNWRMYDFDSPGWRAIRERAEPNRDRLADVFDIDELAAYLPTADQAVPWTFSQTIGRKLLIGLLLWSETHP